jgi:hypothetical protein
MLLLTAFFLAICPAHTQVSHERQLIIVDANTASYPSANRKLSKKGLRGSWPHWYRRVGLSEALRSCPDDGLSGH